MLKNKKEKIHLICLIIIAIIGIIFTFLINNKQSTISDLSILSAQKNNEGKYEAPTSTTFLEKIGFLYLASGLTYQFGVTSEAVEIGFQTILNININEMFNDGNKTDISIEDLNKVETVIDYSTFYDKTEEKTLDSNGKIISEDDITITFTTPKDADINKLTNLWQINYRFYKNGLIGVEPSYWLCELFKEEEYLNRAYTSLKWICQETLNANVITDKENEYSAIIYSSDEKYYWLLYLDRLYDYNLYNTKQNTIAMTVYPISIDEASKILYEMGKILE